jgi:hypothetical protein
MVSFYSKKHFFSILLIAFCLQVCELHSQNKIDLSSGTSAKFSITTLSQYTEVRTVGKTLTYQTTLKIQIENDTQPDWRIVAYTSDNDIPFFGTPPSSISLSELLLSTTASPIDSCSFIKGSPFNPIGEPGETILSGSGSGCKIPFTITLNISYTLKGDMDAKPEGLYFTVLNFELWTKPTAASWP